MVNQNLSKKSTAHAFFKEQAPESKPTAEFSAKLREKVLENYINYNDSSVMKEVYERKGLFIFSTLIAVIALGVGTFMMMSTRTNTNNSNKISGDIAYVEGTVVYKTPNADWQVANVDTILQEGTSIKVAGAGKAIVNLDDGSSVRLNNDSQVTFNSMDPKNIVILNDAGEVYTRVAKADRVFQVKTDAVTYTSLGTAYKTIKTDQVKGVEVYDNRVAVKGAETNDIIVEQGQKYFVENKVQAEEAKKIIAVDIDEVKKDAFVVWNKEQDVKVSEYKDNLGVLEDFEAPVLTISSPQNGATTTDNKVDITGNTEPGARVFINGNEVTNNIGIFTGYVGLNNGENKIQIKSMDMNGNKTFVDLVVVRQAEAQQAPQQPSSWIYLEGYVEGEKAYLNWNVSGVDVSNGFKVVSGENVNPTYPGNNAEYVDSKARSHKVYVKAGKTLHVRVCAYNGNGGCSWYSNDITVSGSGQAQAPKPQPATDTVSSISLSASGTKVYWSTAGTSSQGYKVVWSKQPGPTYPPKEGGYAEYKDASANYQVIPNWEGSATYYVRVCAYKDGTCSVYSNEVVVNVVKD